MFVKKWLSLFLVAFCCAVPALAQDGFNLSTAEILKSPSDVGSWPATVQITGIDIAGDHLAIKTAQPITWPDTPDFSKQSPDGMGPLQYTVWACVKPAHWQCAGFIQMWRTRAVENPASLPPLPSGWNFWWGPNAGGAIGAGFFDGYVPQPGDTIGIFVAAGDERGSNNVTVVKERSNVVTFRLVAGDVQSLTFDGVPPAPPAPPAPPVDPTAGPAGPQGPPGPKGDPGLTPEDVQDLLRRLNALETAAKAKVPTGCKASVFGIGVHCELTF